MVFMFGQKKVLSTMYKAGVFPGKFLPPHRGHINSIINAATKCETLYVVVSDNSEQTKNLCLAENINPIPAIERWKWLSQELQGFDHIKVLFLDETNIPVYPYGWEEWSKLLITIVPENFDVIFGGEISYKENGYTKYFPEVIYEIFDYKRERYPISATEIRKSPFKHWDYILGGARPFFSKKVLITGTESCGKTTLTKYLAKIYHTSWSEEVGRYYSSIYLGGNENVFQIKDFDVIAYQQYENDMKALRTSNKVVFYDTDAVVTQYYCEMYLGEKSRIVQNFVDPSRYDVVILMKPDVKWVDDGLRWNSDDEKRNELHNKLRDMYTERGFNIVEVEGNYTTRLNAVMKIIDELIK